MTQADVGMVMDIEQRAYPFPWTEEILRDCIDVGYDCWLLLRGGEMVGYVIYALAVNEVHVLNLCVVPQYQGQGHGRYMMGVVLDKVRAKRAEVVYLEVRVSNSPAINLYQSLGFTQVGYRKGYYPNHAGREDAVVMKLELSAAPNGSE